MLDNRFMNIKLVLLLICLSVATMASAQTSGGQIRRPGTSKTTFKKASAKKAPIKKQVRRSSIPSKTEPEIETLEVVPIQNATIDGRDISDQAKSAKLHIVIYTADNNLYMANYSERDNTQSWGPLYVHDQKEQPETTSQYATTTLECSWNYQNDYDEKTGTAPVTIEMVNRGDGIYYNITIKADHNLLYQGFVSSEEQTSQTMNSATDVNIQPISIYSLSKYNVVLASFSLLANAQTLCSQLRADGYKDAQIYLDEKKLYRVIGNRFSSELEALRFRSSVRETYPDVWILSIVDGKEKRYFP